MFDSIACLKTLPKQNTAYDIMWNIQSQYSAIKITSKSKRKAIPLQAWRGPEGSRRLRLPAFKTVGT
jgi:hypothetical protein